MQIVEKSLNELTPYKNNPRKNDNAVDAVAASIKAFGFKVPIVIDKEGVIVCGHTRAKAAKKLKIKTVPCVIADDLTEDEIKAFRLADNKVGELAEWDLPALDVELSDLDFDMGEFGFGLLDDDYTNPDEVKEDDFDEEPPAEPKAKRGDIYILGNHRLMCGDSTSKEEVMQLMDGAKGKILFTSPPYSDIREYEGGKCLDTKHVAQFIPAWHDFAAYQCVNLGIKRADGEIVQYWNDYISAAHECGYKLMAWNVWDKLDCGSIGMQKAFFPVRHEWIFVFGNEYFDLNLTIEKKADGTKKRTFSTMRQKDGKLKHTSRGDESHSYKKMESILPLALAKSASDRSGHPAPFPVALPSEYIQAMTNDGDIVCEPFCGGGTTLIACEQLGRKCYAMELEPKYIDLIIARWENLTGQKAEKI
jgi:site-specific DNA-methyltransferase (adenine-specific)